MMPNDQPGKQLKRIFSLLASAVSFFAGASGASAHLGGVSPGAEVFYTGFATIILAFFLINFALKNKVGVYYSLLFAVMLVFIWSLEGGMAAIAPDIPAQLERSISMTVALLGAGFGFFTAECAIDKRRKMPIIRRGMVLLSILAAMLLAPAWIWPSSKITAIAINMIIIAMFGSHVIATMTWRTLSDQPNRFPLFIAGALVVVAIALWALSGNIAPNSFDRVLLTRLVYALVASPTMAAIVLALIDIRRSRDEALEAALAAAKKDAQTSAALLEMEKNYSRAREIAVSRTRKISTVSHDIKQPIASMRAEFDALKNDLAPENVERLDRILSHFSNLTVDLSRSADYEMEEAMTGEPDQAEAVPARLVLTTLGKMFKTEAAAKNIELRIVDSSKIFYAPAVLLMRIASNLVSNALTHSQATKILVGVLKHNCELRLVIADNGVGLPATKNQEDLFRTGVKGAGSEGSGLGLSIVRELSDRQDFNVSVRSIEDRGTSFFVTIPAAT